MGQAAAALSGAPAGSAIAATTLTAGETGVTAEVQRIAITSPWLAFEAREGVKVTFDLALTEDESDAIGHYDSIFSGLGVAVAAQPQGIALATVLEAARVQGPASVRGRQSSHRFLPALPRRAHPQAPPLSNATSMATATKPTAPE